MMVWIHDVHGHDVLINTEYISTVERHLTNQNWFNVRMVNKDEYTVRDEATAAWLTMRE